MVKIYSTEYFCNTKVAGLGEIFSSENFHVYGTLQHTNISFVPRPMHALEYWDGTGTRLLQRYINQYMQKKKKKKKKCKVCIHKARLFCIVILLVDLHFATQCYRAGPETP